MSVSAVRENPLRLLVPPAPAPVAESVVALVSENLLVTYTIVSPPTNTQNMELSSLEIRSCLPTLTLELSTL